MTYPGMNFLSFPDENKYYSGFFSKKEKSQQDIDCYPRGPAFLLLVQKSVLIDSGWSKEEGGGSSQSLILDIYWSYDSQSWEAAILKIEESNKNRAYGQPTRYLAFRIQSIAEVETIIRIK